MSIGPDGKLTVTAREPLGGLPEGIAYSPKSDYLYVGNYFDKDLQVFQLADGKLTEVGPRVKLPGQPASMRAPVR
jgi:DNA-binding beta-propeller fold protein YncE